MPTSPTNVNTKRKEKVIKVGSNENTEPNMPVGVNTFQKS